MRLAIRIFKTEEAAQRNHFSAATQEFSLVIDPILKQPNQQHGKLIRMAVMLGYHLGKDPFEHCQILRKEWNVC